MSLVDVRAGYLAIANGDPTDAEEASTESSSIGQPDDDNDDDDDDEVQSTLSLGSLEDSLPIKRGLSKFYAGKSKSFANLTEVRHVKELEKSENPLNKRRRTLMAMFDKKKKSAGFFYSHSNHISMPLLPLAEVDDDDETDANDYFNAAAASPSFRLQQIKESPSPSPSLNVAAARVSDDSRFRHR